MANTPVTKDEIIRTLNDMNLTVLDIEKLLTDLVQIDLNEYNEINSFGPQIKDFLEKKFNSGNSVSKIVSAQSIINARCNSLKLQIGQILGMIGVTNPENFKPNDYLALIAKIVSDINDLTKEIKGIETDLTKNITTNAIITDSTKVILELIQVVRHSKIKKEFNDNYVNHLWQKLWVENNGNPLSSTIVLNKIKTFHEGFYIIFLENITNNNNFNQNLWDKLINLNYDSKIMNTFFENNTEKLNSNIEQIFLNLLSSKGLTEIVTIYQSTSSPVSLTVSTPSSPANMVGVNSKLLGFQNWRKHVINDLNIIYLELIDPNKESEFKNNLSTYINYLDNMYSYFENNYKNELFSENNYIQWKIDFKNNYDSLIFQFKNLERNSTEIQLFIKNRQYALIYIQKMSQFLAKN